MELTPAKYSVLLYLGYVPGSNSTDGRNHYMDVGSFSIKIVK